MGQLKEIECFSLYVATHPYNQLYRQPLDAMGFGLFANLVMVTLWMKKDATVIHRCASRHTLPALDRSRQGARKPICQVQELVR
jgi:hypothetical protein